jgi:hypothetical protein
VSPKNYCGGVVVACELGSLFLIQAMEFASLRLYLTTCSVGKIL